MLDPEVRTSQAREVVHKGKGCLAVLLSLAILLVGGYLVWDKTNSLLSGIGEVPDYPGPGRQSVIVTIPDGASLGEIGGILVDNKVVKSAKAWDEATQTEARATSIQSGRYQMKTEMKAVDALALLINPGESRIRREFTVPEGLRLSAQIDALVKATGIKKSDFADALKEPKALGLPSYADGKAEGFLFPDTYEQTAGATAASTLKQMVDQYRAVAADLELEARAKKLKRDPLDVVIVASIIEKEVSREADRSKVARVLYNRLDDGRKLELDSTVVYAEKLKTNTTTPQDRKSKSKYNTYRYEGLPPGPISAPGRAALEAAANPAAGDWLYFVTVNFETGETEFGKTEADFRRMQAKFQKYCRDNPGTCDS
jgi:UPF0755 protein